MDVRSLEATIFESSDQVNSCFVGFLKTRGFSVGEGVRAWLSLLVFEGVVAGVEERMGREVSMAGGLRFRERVDGFDGCCDCLLICSVLRKSGCSSLFPVGIVRMCVAVFTSNKNTDAKEKEKEKE